MKDLDVISKVEKEYGIKFLLGVNEYIDEEYFNENCYFIGNSDEITKLVINNLNSPLDLKHIIGLSKLEVLIITSNKINNFSEITYLKNLKQLSLKECFIKDLTPLKNLKKLSFLDLNLNEISDISFIKELDKPVG